MIDNTTDQAPPRAEPRVTLPRILPGSLCARCVIAGSILALGCQAAFSLLGVALLYGLFDQNVQDPLRDARVQVAVGSWWFVTGWVSLYCGAWIAEAVRRTDEREHGIVHAMLVWAVFMVAQAVVFEFAVSEVIATSALRIDMGDQALDWIPRAAVWAFIASAIGLLVALIAGGLARERSSGNDSSDTNANTPFDALPVATDAACGKPNERNRSSDGGDSDSLPNQPRR